MTKRFFLVLLALLLVLSIFTACDDDDDNSADYNEESEESRACTEEDYEIIVAIVDAVDEAIQDDDNVITASYSESGTTGTFTFKTYTCTVNSYYDNLEISVTIESGSTVEAAWYSDNLSVRTYNVDATVDGTSRSLYIKAIYVIDTPSLTFLKIELDGVVLTGIEGTSLKRPVAAEASAESEESEESEDYRVCTEEDYEIIYAIYDACAEGMITEDTEYVDSEYSTFTSSYTEYEYVTICTFNTYTCTVTSRIDKSDISVTIESGSTLKITSWSANNTSYTTSEYSIDATIDGTSRSLYMVETFDLETYEIEFYYFVLDDVILTGVYDIASSLAV